MLSPMFLFRFSLLIVLMLCVVSSSIYAQNTYWKKSSNEKSPKGQRYIQPDKFDVYTLDFESIRQILNLGQRNVVKNQIDLPMPNNKWMTFDIQETNIFDQELASKYPEFSSFTGYGPNGELLKLSISPYGVNAMIFLTENGVVFIDPLTLQNEEQLYQVYYKHDFTKKTGNFTCGVKSDASQPHELTKLIRENNGARVGDCLLRSYRLAISCTGEYAKFHGGTKEKVLAAYNTTMTRVNGVYEKDAGITMKLIGNTDKLIFLNGNTDPYTNNNGEIMLDENQTTIDNIIGRSNYDIGHVFSTDGGGIASLRSPCTSSKAMGVTGQPTPVGDPFDIDYVAHEMGHQFGANHTQNNDCQRESDYSVEPGSGSTIMGYAGICSPDVQSNSDAYFHGINLGEIASFVVSGTGNSCAQKINVENNAPTVNVAKNSYTIPISTAFVLTANGSDIDGDTLTYCWEQIDPEFATMPPVSSSTKGPAFRSINPKTSPSRYFPDLGRKYGNWEVLPSVSRIMDFMCTVRDNHKGKGCTDEVNVRVTTSVLAGPFTVTVPNITSVSWLIGSTQTITWDLAKTDAAPINCKNVNIYLSVDGGLTYPHVLAENVPNTGSYTVLVPNQVTTKARVMVMAADNIFYDVSNANFKIYTSFNMSLSPSTADICTQQEFSTLLNFTQNQSLNVPIELNVINPISGVNYDFSLSSIQSLPAESSLIITGLEKLPLGWNFVEIQAVSGQEKQTITLSLFVGFKDNPKINLIQPPLNATKVDNENVLFNWQKVQGAKNYTLEVSTSPAFNPLAISVLVQDTFATKTLLENQVYYWRVKPTSPCTSISSTISSSFKTDGVATGSVQVLTNVPLVVGNGQLGIIDTTKLHIQANDKQAVVFTVVSKSSNGLLMAKGNALNVGSTFSLTDIASNLVTYQHGGNSATADSFIVNILDDKNKWLPNVKFDIVIDQGELMVVASNLSVIKCFGSETGKIVVEGFNGTPPYQYSLDGQNFTSNNVFNNLGAGTFTIQIKDMDNNISISNEVKIAWPQALTLDYSIDKYLVSLAGNGGTGELLYSVNALDFSTMTEYNLYDQGSYTLKVKDENGCITTDVFTQNIPPLEVYANITNDVICANQNATIVVDAQGGFSPYEYSSDGQNFVTSNSFQKQPGSYVFWVKDAGGMAKMTDTIFTKTPIGIQVLFENDRFKVKVLATGGTGPLQYSRNNVEYGSNNVFEFSDNGSYKIYVRDSLGCTKVTTYVLNVLKVNITKRNTTCNNDDGYIKITPTGGQLPITYELENKSLGSKNEWTNLSGGTYKYRVKDAKDDSITGEIVILGLKSPIILAIESGNKIEIQVIEGDSPFQYSIHGGITFVDTSNFYNLASGIYNVVVKDVNGCTTEETIEIKSGAEDASIYPIEVIPNPTLSMIQFKGLPIDLNGAVEITNQNGQLINALKNINFHQYPLDISSLPAGLYFVKIISKDKLYIGKVVKIGG